MRIGAVGRLPCVEASRRFEAIGETSTNRREGFVDVAVERPIRCPSFNEGPREAGFTCEIIDTELGLDRRLMDQHQPRVVLLKPFPRLEQALDVIDESNGMPLDGNISPGYRPWNSCDSQGSRFRRQELCRTIADEVAIRTCHPVGRSPHNRAILTVKEIVIATAPNK